MPTPLSSCLTMSMSSSVRNTLMLFLFVCSAVMNIQMHLMGQNLVKPCPTDLSLLDLPHEQRTMIHSSKSSSAAASVGLTNGTGLPIPIPVQQTTIERVDSLERTHSSSLLSSVTSSSGTNTETKTPALSSLLSLSASPRIPSGLHAPNSAMLPMPNENGIIIFYYHIPKTGGTTQMAPFVRNPDWRYRMVYGPGKQKRYRKEFYSWFDNWHNNTRVYYEYHAGKASPYMDQQVRQDIQTWRAMAKERNIPFFAFTVVREPLSFAVSHFNFYYASGKFKDPRYYWRPDATEQDFLELSLPNPQCLFAVHSEVAYYEEYREAGNPIHVSKEGCESVYKSFLEDFDWVGTTETLSTQTFPILEQIGEVRYCPEVRNQSNNKISKRSLSQKALDHVRNITSHDQFIYDSAVRDFPFRMWRNFDTTPKPPRNPNKRCKYKTGQPLPPGELPKRAGERRRFLEANPGFVAIHDME